MGPGSSTPFSVHSGCCHRLPPTGRSGTTDIDCSRFWRLTAQGQGARRSPLAGRDGPHCVLMGPEARGSSLGPLSSGAPPPDLVTSLGLHLPPPSPLEVRISVYEFWGDTNIQTISPPKTGRASFLGAPSPAGSTRVCVCGGGRGPAAVCSLWVVGEPWTLSLSPLAPGSVPGLCVWRLHDAPALRSLSSRLVPGKVGLRGPRAGSGQP